MSKIKLFIKYFRMLNIRYKAYIFAFLFCSVLGIIYFCSKFYKYISIEFSVCKTVLNEQNAWLNKRDDIFAKYDETITKLKQNSIKYSTSLMSVIEQCTSDLECQYELSNEKHIPFEDIIISNVNVNFYGITLASFIKFSNMINVDGITLTNLNLHVVPNGSFNIKCLIESIVLNQ